MCESCGTSCWAAAYLSCPSRITHLSKPLLQSSRARGLSTASLHLRQFYPSHPAAPNVLDATGQCGFSPGSSSSVSPQKLFPFFPHFFPQIQATCLESLCWDAVPTALLPFQLALPRSSHEAVNLGIFQNFCGWEMLVLPGSASCTESCLCGPGILCQGKLKFPLFSAVAFSVAGACPCILFEGCSVDCWGYA